MTLVNMPLFSFIFYLVIVVIVSFWAIDRSRNLEGIINAIVVLEWAVYCSLAESKEKDELVDIIPITAAVLIVVSMAALAFPNLSSYLWQADRLGGLFQYSNTCALYLLIGLIIEVERGRTGKYLHYGIIAILMLGIMLTGSRTVAIIMIGWAVYKFVTSASNRKAIAITGIIMAVAVAFSSVLLNNTQNFGRLATIMEYNSTFWGRLLYDIDGVRMLASHPFGMGYMGYYYVQGGAQTGVYTTMFVHNDILQMGLDYGIIPMLLLVAFTVNQIIKGKNDRLSKALIIIIMLASLADFHLQYPSIVMVLVLCFDLDCELPFLDRIGRKTTDKKGKVDNTIAILVSGLLFIASAYMLIAFRAVASENISVAGKMLGKNTQVLESVLDRVSSAEETEAIVKDILKVNKYSSKAWRYQAYVDTAKGDYDSAIDCIDKALSLNKYNVDMYKAFDALLLDMYAATDDEAMSDRILAARDALPKRLAELEKDTSSLAYRLKDKPEFAYN